jgi:hypothetical protein
VHAKLPLQKSSFSPATAPEKVFDGAKLTWECVVDVGASSSSIPDNGARKSLDCYRWRGGDGVNNRPVGKPQEEGMMNIAATFSLSKKPRFVSPGKSQTPEGDAC